MRDRLIELLKKTPLCNRDFDLQYSDGTIEKFADYLLKNGVIVPPCKVGDTAYVTVERLRMPRGVYQGVIKSIILTEDQIFAITKLLNNSEVTTPIQDVFPSKEEAEKALKGGEGE